LEKKKQRESGLFDGPATGAGDAGGVARAARAERMSASARKDKAAK
jgi:hypothetical protein